MAEFDLARRPCKNWSRNPLAHCGAWYGQGRCPWRLTPRMRASVKWHGHPSAHRWIPCRTSPMASI
eukprot:113642-Lingulodinium_polyedra.AAC.1